jgi:hypothetical protein
VPTDSPTGLTLTVICVFPVPVAGVADNHGAEEEVVQVTVPPAEICGFGYEQELSNNLAENSMRPIALGRKNRLHVGSVKAGPKVAAILSVVESCRRLQMPLRDYLLDVLPGLDSRKLPDVARLTPANWSAARA